MTPDEYAAQWSTRRRRQIWISGGAAVFIVLLVAGAALFPGALRAAPIAFYPIVFTLAGLSMWNARCPSCKRLLGSGIFRASSCSRCDHS